VALESLEIYATSSNSMKAYLIPRLRDVLFIAIFFAALLLGPRMLNMDGDLPRHLAIGKYVLQGNPPPINDIYSYTKYGEPFAPHKWLSGVLFYIAYAIFAEKGVVLLSGIVLAATFTLIYASGVARTGLRLPVLMIVAWGAAVSALHWIIRPHLFTMLLLAIWLILTEQLARGKKIRWWVFPALMLVWNNIHGEFIAGMLVTFAYLAGWVWDYLLNGAEAKIQIGKQLGLALITSVIVSIVNPVSLRAWATVTSWLGNDYLMAHTQETVPPNFQDARFLILLALIVFSLFLLGIKRERLRTGDVFALAGFTALTLLSARNVHLYGVVAPFILVNALTGSKSVPLIERFEDLFARVEDQARGIVWIVATVLAGLIILAATPIGHEERFSPAFFPVQAVEWLKTHPQNGEMFNTFDWGGYLSFELGPEKKVFIDSQGDIYGEAFIRQYEQIVTLRDGWQAVLEQYHVSWAILPREWPLAKALAEEGWREVYRDETAIILVKGE
jgi:hypothetical protein